MPRIHRFYFTGQPPVSPETTEYPEYGLILDVTEEDVSASKAYSIDRVVEWCQDGSNALSEYEREHGLVPGDHTFRHELVDVAEEERGQDHDETETDDDE